jgi:opacity protein-like surface antigen
MKIQNLFYLCAIFVLSTANSFALGKAASMGNLQTVVPSGPFDTARNPALLATQTQANSTGLFCSYITHFQGDYTENTNQNLYEPGSPDFDSSIQSNNNKKDPEIKGMSGRISNSLKSGNSVLGFAFTDNGNDQFLETKNESTIERYGIDNVNNIMIYSKGNEISKTTEINPAFISSLGSNISNTSFVGFQVIIGYSNIKEEKKSFVENTKLSPIPLPPFTIGESFEEKQDKETKKITSEVGIGYLYRDNNQQIGLLLRTGELSWIEKKLSVHRENYIPVNPPENASSSLKMSGKYTSGPSVVVGAYKRINSGFAFAFESGIEIKNSYVDRDLEYRADTNTVQEEKSSTTVNNIYSFKAGIEMNLSDQLTLTLGIGYLTGLFENQQRKENGTYSKEFNAEMDIKYGISTFGIQYILSKNITIDFITALMPYKKIINIRMREENTAPSTRHSEFNSEQRDEGMFLHTGLGVTMSF